MVSRASAQALFPVVAGDPRARAEVRGWCLVAVGALAVAGLFALLLALSRTPGLGEWVPWPEAFFRKALVIHVVFAFVIWFLAVFGALLAVTAHETAGGRPRWNGLGPVGLWGVVLACVLLLTPALMDRGEPTLNNYVPAIVDPVYYAGLVLLAAALSLPVLRLAATRPAAAPGASHWAVAGGGVIYAVALVAFALAYRDLAGQAPGERFNEELFWGGGHMLQFLSTILLVAAWAWLGRIVLGEDLIAPSLVKVAVAILVLGVWPAPAFYFVFEPFSAHQMEAFSGLLWLLGPPTLIVALGGVAALRRRRVRGGAIPWGDPVFLCLVLSVAVFGLGGVLGMFIDGTDTRTPAHYHGSIAGVTLAFMGLFHGLFLPLLGRARASARAIRAQAWLFGGGQALACVGLFWAGGYGTPRKTAGAAQGLADWGAVAGMTLNGIGGAIAVIGGVMFIWLAARALLGAPAPIPAETRS